MSDYDLHTHLTARSFEQLVQAIAVKVLGPGTVIFGDGPDGGREATFDGEVPYPSEKERWKGSIVVQAKFRQRPVSTKKDAEWALAQLDREIKAFTTRRRRYPDYYIFATNVVLTPAAGGSKDKALKKLIDGARVRGAAIWDADQIRAFLDNYADIRRSYRFWVTPSELLARMLERITADEPDFRKVVASFLTKELLADQHAHLETAGYKAEERIPLSQVFVDLPISTEMHLGPPDEDPKKPATLFIDSMIEDGDARLNPSTVEHERRVALAAEPTPGRAVLLGGPGQGKSTLGQYLCQIYRTSLLRVLPQHLLGDAARPIIAAIGAKMAGGEIREPRAMRFPFRVVLSEYADYLAVDGQQRTSLLSYIALMIGQSTPYPVKAADISRWLSMYPWCLVLDGLDEVPVSGNRERVLEMIQNFWVDAANVDADLLVVATCRPQGYNRDFSPHQFRHLWLVPLSPARAIGYAEKLLQVRFGAEPSRLSRIDGSIRRAASAEATSRLMRTPLQVTIMSVLVDQGGDPPQERWRLFRKYFSVMYERETQRPIAYAQILRDFQPDIEDIHRNTALVLQILSERSGNAEARMPDELFGRIVEQRLREEKHSGARLVELRDALITAACERLVFLVGLQSGQIGFEIRSLQEYMAAEALMHGGEVIADRLREIAPLVSWRNVFLFAAGSCFAERQYLRPAIHTLCAQLNDDAQDLIAREARIGSVIAMDLLEDGSARRQPGYVKLITRLAMRILELPPGHGQERLAKLYDEELEEIYREQIEAAINSRNLLMRRSGWQTLFFLKGRASWARAVIDHLWPETLERQLDAYRGAGGHLELLPQVPMAVGVLLQKWRPTSELQREVLLYVGKGTFAVLSIKAIQAVRSMTSDWSWLRPEWRLPAAVGDFLAAPSAEQLANVLDVAAQTVGKEDHAFIRMAAPWVVTACVETCGGEPERMRELASRIRRGQLGDSDQWIAAQSDWFAVGLKLEDLEAAGDPLAVDPMPFPFAAANVAVADGGRIDASHVARLVRIATSTPSRGVRRVILEMLERVFYDDFSLMETGALDLVIADVPGAAARLVNALEVRVVDENWVAIADAIGRSPERRSVGDRIYVRLYNSLADAIRRNPHRYGLVNLAAELLAKDPSSNAFPRGGYQPPEACVEARLIMDITGTNIDEADLRANALRIAANDPASAQTIIAALWSTGASHLELLAELKVLYPAAAAYHADDIVNRLEESIHARRSPFDRREVWERLQLPAGLAEIVAAETPR
jgi:hypothetical protein